MQRMTKEERAIRDADFKNRERPRLLWDSTREGPAIAVVDAQGRKHYDAKPIVQKRKATLTEAQDNAIGRALRRRQHKAERGWLPHAKR